MKMAFVVYNDYVNPQMMDMLKRLNIDYYLYCVKLNAMIHACHCRGRIDHGQAYAI